MIEETKTEKLLQKFIASGLWANRAYEQMGKGRYHLAREAIKRVKMAMDEGIKLLRDGDESTTEK